MNLNICLNLICKTYVMILILVFNFNGYAYALNKFVKKSSQISTSHRFSKVNNRTIRVLKNKASKEKNNQSPPSSTTSNKKLNRGEFQNNWNISFMLGYSQNLFQEQGVTPSKSFDGTITAAVPLSENYSFNSSLSAYDPMNDTDPAEMSDFTLGISRKRFEFFSNENNKKLWNLGLSTTAILPLDQNSYKSSYYQGGINFKVSSGPTSNLLGTNIFSVSSFITFSQKFHKYTESFSGRVNNKYGSTQGLNFNYDVNDSIGFGLTGSHINSWTYNYSSTEFYNHSEYIYLNINSSLNVSLSHSLGASIYGPQDPTLRFEAFDDEKSFINLDLTYTFGK